METVDPSMMEPDLTAGPENQSEDEFEDLKQVVVRGRKRKAKDDSSVAKRGRGGGRGRGRVQRTEEEESDGSMFEIVKAGRASLQIFIIEYLLTIEVDGVRVETVVDDWIESYKNDRDQALLELIQFLIQSAGCKGKVTPYMYANMEHAEIIRKMTEEFDEDSGDYPLIMTGPQWKKFKTNFCEFIQVLVRQCQYSIIYDQYMMDNVISLLTGLTDSQVRAFRHTSTLASMKLMTALVDVALNLSINLDNTQRQYESERQKNQNKRATDRLNLLLVKRQELEDNQSEIRNMLTYIFKGVFVHRYRDTQADIRAICMKEIGVWMKKYPNMFVDDGYLKYVGWTLYDKVGEVRLCCLKALYPLYENDDLSRKMELFTNRFKDRIVEMTLDKETEVAVQGVRLVISILKLGETVLSDKDCENVYELVYSSHRQIAQAAGEFLNAKLFRRDEEATRNLRTGKGKKRSPNTPLIRDLVQFFIESELHEHGAYLVDSLWEINEMMKDWECMTDLLLEEPGKGEEALDDRQETSLIEIMVCCVKQAGTGESPVGRGPGNRKLTAKENKQVLEDKSRLTEHFIVALPQLLLKYLMDPEKVANLLHIPLYFDLEMYTAGRQEKNLEALLRYLHEIVEKHTDSEVLEACSRCYESLCSDEYAISGKCDVARKTLIDSLVVKFRESMQDFFQEGEQPDEDDAYALVAALKRINALYSCHNLNSWGLWDELFHVVKMAIENPGLTDEIVCKAIGSCYMALLWYLQKLDEHNPDKDDMLRLKHYQKDLFASCQQLLYHNQDKISEEAFVTICDSLVVFSRNLENPTLKPLVYEPEKSLQNQLSSFLMDKVFVEDEDDDADENVKIEELHKRRNFLACFCKLIVYNIVPIKVAAPMFKHYMKFYNDYGDIIKATLGKAREINKVATAKALASSLTQLFKELQDEQGGQLDKSSDAFQSIKELARRFSLSFGLDQVKNREAVAAMHREGILFSLSNAEADPNAPPPCMAFLEVLCEFTNKLMKQDKKTVLNYLDKQLAGLASTLSDNSQSLMTYRNSLVQGEHEIHPITLKQAAQRRYGKRKAEQSIPNEDSSNLSDQSHWSDVQTPAPHLGMPQHASTAVKRRRMDEDSNPSEMDGSEQDYQDSGAVGYSQAPWLSTQHRMQELQHQQSATYATHPQHQHMHELSHLESERSSEGNISEFESPQMGGAPRHPHYHAHHHYYDSSQPSIDDASHGRGLQVVHLPLPPTTTGVSSDISHPGF